VSLFGVNRPPANGCSELDPSYFVLMVDLWSGDGRSEVNLVRHSATSPSISATTASSYPPQSMPINTYPYGHPMAPMAGYGPPPPYGYPPQNDGYGHPPAYHAYDQHRGYHQYGSTTPITPTSQYAPNGGSQGPLMSPTAPVMITQDPRSAPTGMFTRNLIGSLSVSAFKLTDTHGKLGIWFILQDLSVRTEGTFRCVEVVGLFMKSCEPFLFLR
jgi:Velvet factor